MPDLVKLGLWDKEKNRIKDNAKQVVQENRQAIRESNVRTQASRGGEAAKRIGQAGIGSSSKLNLSSAKPATSARSETKTNDSDDLTGKSGRFFLARIGEIAQTNPDEGEKLYNMYQSERSNPSSPLYDIYANATSNNAKYNAQTEKAMGEWQALQQELSYWAQSDRNYSDDEIIGRINWKNYPTLSKMNNTKNGGQTVYLTQPIGYNEDAMYGVLWAARNPELSTGDYSTDAVLSAMGRGKEYQRDETKAGRLDPTSTSYNPYLVGSTMDSEIQHFGVNGFDADWLNNNLQYRGTDEYASVYKAEQTTAKAEKELADLQAELEADLASGLTLDEAFSDELLDDYPTLRSMQQGLDKGSPVSITRPVAYDLPSLKSAYDQSYQQLFGTESNADYAASVAESTGAQPRNNAARDKVTDAAALTQRQYFGAIWQAGTNDEKKSMSSSGSVDYAPSVADIQSSIQQGTGGKQGAMSSKQLTVSQQTSAPFFEAMDARTGAEKDAGFTDDSKKLLEYAGISPEDVSPDDPALAYKIQKGLYAAGDSDYQAQAYLQNFDTFFENLQYQASLVADTNERTTAADEQLAAIDQQWKDAFGDDTPEYRAHKYAMETIYSFKDAPKPDWNAYDVVGYAAQQEGATEEDTTRTALSALAINNQQIAYLKTLMEQSEQYGVPEEYLANMQATVENLEKSNRLIASYSLKNSGDYAQGVAAFDELTFDTSPDAYNSGRGSAENVIRAISNPESIQDYDNSPNRVGGPFLMSLAQADPDVAYTELMTDAERNNFKYLYATQGEESAMAYFSDLRSQLSARYAQEESEKYQQFGEKLPVTASVSSILASPAQLQGFMYTIGQAIAGEQADPNSPWFSSNRFVSGTRQGTKDAFADAVGDNETAKNIFNFFYDALMSSGDSLVSAGMGGATGLANAGLAIMSAEAASNAMQEALYKGADSKTAAFAGLAAGAAEAITEKIPFDKLTELYHAGSTGGKVLKLIADNVIGEGVGEGASEYLGALGDYLVMGDDSDFVQSVEQYKADGMTEDEAVRQAVTDLTQQALMAALAGTVSGMASSGVGYAAGKLSGSNADVQQNQQEQQQQNQQQENQQQNQQTGEQANQQEQQAQQTEAAPAAVEPENVTSDNAVNVLYKAQQNGVGQMQQTASVDAALRSFGVRDEAATAAAKNVIASDSLAKVTKFMENAQDKYKASLAVTTAMLAPDGRSAAAFAALGDTITAEDVAGLIQMYELDMRDNAVLQAFDAAVENSQVADETVAALGQMDSSGVKGAQNSLKKAKQAEKTFRENLARESANVNAADQALDSARQARIQNMNPDTIAAEKKALENRSKAMEKWNDAKQKHLEAQQAVADARTELQDVQEAAVNQARTEALGKQQERQAAAQEAQEQAALEGMSYTERFAKELDAWDGQAKGKEFTVGHTSDLLLSLGAPDADINLLSDKVIKIKKDHLGMTDDVIRQIPSVVENPVVVMKSQTVPDRLTMFGELMDANGAPVLAVIDTSMKTTTKTGRIDVDFIRMNSVYGKDTRTQNFIDKSEILYVDKNRADSWSRSTRLKLPIGEDTIGSADSIPQNTETVNSSISDSAANDSGQGNSSQGISQPIAEQQSMPVTQQEGRQQTFNSNVQENAQQPQNGLTAGPEGQESASAQPTDGNRYGTSQFATKTGQKTTVLLDEVKQKLKDNPLYRKASQKASMDRAIQSIETQGYEARKTRMLDGATDILTPDGQVEAYVLSEIAKENGDAEGQAAIAFKVKESGTLLAQSLAMRQIYLNMSPEANAIYVQRLVDQINSQYEFKHKSTRVTMPGWVEQALLDAGDNQKQVAEVLDRAYREIAQQMPYSVKDTLNTWRYLCMLGNPLTHIKNIAANAAFMPYVATKNRIAAGLEIGVSEWQRRTGREITERSKTLGPLKKEYRDFARSISEQQQDVLSGNEKADAGNGGSKVNEYRQKAPALIDKLSKANSWLLGGEDLIAKNHYFRYALASYLQANKVDLNNISDGMLERAIQYSVNEAYKNTFNNVNEFGKMLSKAERNLANSANPVAKGAGILLEGTIPFKNTPANIVSRGVEYSPVGLVNALTLNVLKLKRGMDYQGNAYTVQNFVDSIASGLTGTMAVALGAVLANSGALELGDEEDDEVRGTNKNSINLFGYNIGIDWMGVAAMPLLMGAKLAKSWEDKNGEPLSWKDIESAFLSIADPVMDLSMVQGITALLESASYSDNSPGEMAMRMGTSYLSQFFPSVFGAITRTFFDDTRRTTYTDKNSDVNSNVQYMLQSIRNKIPGLSKQGLPYMDVWGNDEKTESGIQRFLTNFLLPGYPKKIETDDEVTEYLLAMYDEYGDSKYLPTKAKKKFSVNGETYHLSQAEYEQYAKERGSIAHDLLGQLMADEQYLSAEPEYQLDAIGNVWTYASQTAAYHINDGYKLASWVGNTTDPKATILEKMEENIRTDKRDKWKSSFFDAYEDGDIRSMQMCVAGLEELGYKKSSLKSAVKTQYQAKYIEMYESGDMEGMQNFRDAMIAADIGFKASDFAKWLKD